MNWKEANANRPRAHAKLCEILTRRFALGVLRSCSCSCSCVVACRKGVSTQLEAPSRNCTPRPGGWECLQGSRFPNQREPGHWLAGHL
jgi:hypothetical protein